MSCASSNQSMVRDGTKYEEVYPSGHKDQESPGEERSPSASSSSSINEDMEMAELEDISDDGEGQPVRFVIGADGLREFIMLPEWTVHKFTSVIKEKHFNTFRVNFKFLTTFQSVCPTYQRNAITTGWKVSECMNRC